MHICTVTTVHAHVKKLIIKKSAVYLLSHPPNSTASTGCTDRMQFFDSKPITQSDPLSLGDAFCGEDVGSKTKYELPNNSELHFYSSLCCQNCGSYIWMSCSRPQYSRIVTKVRKVTLLDEQRIYGSIN